MSGFSPSRQDLIDDLVRDLTNRSKDRSLDFEMNANVHALGEGLFARTAIDEGALLVSVAFTECISCERIKHSPLKKILDDNPGLEDYPDEVLALGLMYGKVNVDCEWYLHCQAMPSSIDTPLFWSDSDRSLLLKECNNFFVSNILKRQVAADWDSIHGPFSEQYPDLLGAVKISTYEWALSMVYSRALGFKRHGKYTRCIVPVVDMANHFPRQGKHSADTFHFAEERDAVQLKACTSYTEGAECFAIYGDYSNAKLLHTYGFVLPDAAPLALDVWPNLQHHLQSIPSPSLEAMKRDVLAKFNLGAAASDYTFNGSIRAERSVDESRVSIDERLLTLARLMQASEDEVVLMMAPSFKGGRVGVRNETAAYTALKELFTAVRERLLSGALSIDPPTTASSISSDADGPAMPPPEITTDVKARWAKVVREDDCYVLELAAKKAQIELDKLRS